MHRISLISTLVDLICSISSCKSSAYFYLISDIRWLSRWLSIYLSVYLDDYLYDYLSGISDFSSSIFFGMKNTNNTIPQKSIYMNFCHDGWCENTKTFQQD